MILRTHSMLLHEFEEEGYTKQVEEGTIRAYLMRGGARSFEIKSVHLIKASGYGLNGQVNVGIYTGYETVEIDVLK